MLVTYWFFGNLLVALHGALPKMSLIASDFNYIPNVKEPGERAALVSTNDDVDIFFQTDFISVIGILKITIIQGTNLDVRDMLSSDHYVVVSLEKELEEKWIAAFSKSLLKRLPEEVICVCFDMMEFGDYTRTSIAKLWTEDAKGNLFSRAYEYTNVAHGL
ncbi:hypothetical protein Tco_0238692 [Tanacetum coccineum]